MSCCGPGCAPQNPLPNGRVLRTHLYYGKRPQLTYMYGESPSCFNCVQRITCGCSASGF